MVAQWKADGSQQLECLELSHPGTHVEQQVAQALRAVRCCEFKGGQLINVAHGPQTMLRLHEELARVMHLAADATQRIDEVRRNFQPVIGRRGFSRNKILPACQTNPFAAGHAYAGVAQDRRQRGA